VENLFFLPVLALIGISISAALLGIFVLWKKMAYFGDALGHSSIFGLALSSIFDYNLFLGFVIFAIIFTVLVHLIDQKNLYSKDTIIAIISYAMVAIGLILISTNSINFDLDGYLIGDIASVSVEQTKIIYCITAIIVIATTLWFKKLLLTIINEDLAKIEGIKTENLKLKFSLILALFIAVAIKIIGIFLITAILILPPAIAKNFSNSPIKMIPLTIAISIVASSIGFYFYFFFILYHLIPLSF
jgi:zinc transport system permease protein